MLHMNGKAWEQGHRHESLIQSHTANYQWDVNLFDILGSFIKLQMGETLI